MEGELTRTFMQNLIMVQTSCRQAIQKSMKKHEIDLTFEMLQILIRLWKKDGVNQQELASNTFKDKASLTPLLNNLEKKGLVKRVSDSVDRRNKMVYLTDLGHEYGQKVKPILYEIYDSAEKKMQRQQVEICIEYMQNLNKAFKEYE